MIITQERSDIMSCPYYKYKSGTLFGYYWCIKDNKEVQTSEYEKYCRGYYYDECPIYRQSQSSGCFITTIVCDILKKQDNDELLENLREFRNNILQPNENYHDILKEYDVIGPKLADCIINDHDKEKMASCLYENALLPINKKINNKEYDSAIEMYYLMTLSLVNYYGLKHEYGEIKERDYDYEDFNPSKSGHGLRKIKTL